MLKGVNPNIEPAKFTASDWVKVLKKIEMPEDPIGAGAEFTEDEIPF
jgi:hypothetical protein